MRINLQMHARALSSLKEIFEPANNLAYAALLLKTLYYDARS